LCGNTHFFYRRSLYCHFFGMPSPKKSHWTSMTVMGTNHLIMQWM
jgi:hypothetical protein